MQYYKWFWKLNFIPYAGNIALIEPVALVEERNETKGESRNDIYRKCQMFRS